ncbi:MAG: PLP-dependent aminotransferase family protein, partial [Bradyrhizobium sp.]
GLHLVARFDPSVSPSVAAEAKTAAGVEGWLLAETYHRAPPLPGFVLGFAGHPIPLLKASAEKLARASLAALRASRKPNAQGTGTGKSRKPVSAR